MVKQQFIEKLVNQRLNVLKAAEGLSDQELSKPMGEGKWSVKDMLGHLAAWEGEVVRAFEQKASGQRPTIGDIKDFDSWNSVEAGKRRDRTPDQIRNELND
ncbi:MAG TPA: DinB family protein, partial [Blastocatellia bacterium]|nr:DinB family protein [Blastocatellia bacterium]